jgi:thioester reductase-like protein
LISWCTQTGHFNKNDWFIHLLSDFIELGSVPDIDRTFILTPVDRISQWIVELSESKLRTATPITFDETYMVSFKDIWKEICSQQQIKPHYLNLEDWYRKFEQKSELNTSNILVYLREIFETDEHSSNISAQTNENVKNINLPFFVDALIQSRSSL